MGARFFEPEGGLRFTCKRCSDCCRHESGYVFLSQDDVRRLARCLRMTDEAFLAAYCRKVDGASRLSLKEKADFDCVLWNDGCTVYEARPLQCRAFPFWPRNLVSREAWRAAASSCPGVDSGALHPAAEIDAWLAAQGEE
ncbi:MAG: YkgJ family cysteine cluster protein [Treponema sp.]|jgi:Fe-S-cluster containining protein|nr:YkgJ family cysteine cluster protein [Treponema sp.]